MQTGIDILFKTKPLLARLKHKKIALLVHAASINSKLEHTLDLFTKHPNLNVVKIFGPEHGLWATAQDMEHVDSTIEPHTKLPIKSLYGKSLETLKPTLDDLKDIDVLICDLQDIGSRYYTFIYTTALCLEACAKAKVEVWVLDRPNPINGVTIEGNLLEPGFESFVGFYAGLPVRHGMTMGELALYLNTTKKMGCNLNVIKLKNWNRKHYFDQTQLPWVLPSPNMPTLDTAIVYPGMCLIEATHLSEGRGTTRPFELVGAPYINPYDLVETLNQWNLDGITFRPLYFKPTFQKWTGTECGGLQLHVTNRKKFKPFLTGLALLASVIYLYPNKFEWRHAPYEFVKETPAIDLLCGGSWFRKLLKNENNIGKIKKEILSLEKKWNKNIFHFKKEIKPFLLY